jgi:dolichol kinase
MPLSKQEINRKLFHLFALILPAGIFYLPKIRGSSGLTVIVILTLLLLGILFIEILRFHSPKTQEMFQTCFVSMLRREESKTLTGSSYYIASALICAILFRDAPHISFMVLTLFILGDAIAALVGQSMGKIRIGQKSLEGSLACFILCLILCVAVFPHVPLLLDSWDGAVPLPLVFITAFAITLFELIPIRLTRHLTLNDNLSVPVIAGLIMDALYPLF